MLSVEAPAIASAGGDGIIQIPGSMMCKTIKQRVKFKAPPAVVYELLSDSVMHTAVTGRKAIISREIGGAFSVSGNDVTGINVDLVPGRRIVQAWRHRQFPEGIFSMAAVTLAPTRDGGTELILTHRGVPKDLIPETERAWREQYWARIKAYLVETASSGRDGASRTTRNQGHVVGVAGEG